MANMEPPRSEHRQYSTRTFGQNVEREHKPRQVIFTKRADRELKAPVVQLQRTDGKSTVQCVTDACRGVGKDIKNWKKLKGTSLEKIKQVCTNDGRLPYLVLVIAVAFLVFFALMYVGRAVMSGGGKPRVLYAGGRNVVTSAPVPVVNSAVVSSAVRSAPSIGPVSFVQPKLAPAGAMYKMV